MRTNNKELQKLKNMLDKEEIDESTYRRLTQKLSENYNLKEKNDYIISNSKSEYASSIIIRIIAILFLIIIVVFIIFFIKNMISSVTSENNSIAKSNSFPNDVIDPSKGVRLNYNGYPVDVEFISKYVLKGRVIATKGYFGNGLQDTIAPYDLGISWGTISTDKNNEHVQASIDNRRLTYRVAGTEQWFTSVGGENHIHTHISNNHLVPCNNEIKNNVQIGDTVTLTGYLIKVYYYDNNKKILAWESSTTRRDNGDGACETMYVTSITY